MTWTCYLRGKPQQESRSNEPDVLYRIDDEERQNLEKLTTSGIAPVWTVTRAHSLLKSDKNAIGYNWK